MIPEDELAAIAIALQTLRATGEAVTDIPSKWKQAARNAILEDPDARRGGRDLRAL